MTYIFGHRSLQNGDNTEMLGHFLQTPKR